MKKIIGMLYVTTPNHKFHNYHIWLLDDLTLRVQPPFDKRNYSLEECAKNTVEMVAIFKEIYKFFFDDLATGPNYKDLDKATAPYKLERGSFATMEEFVDLLFQAAKQVNAQAGK